MITKPLSMMPEGEHCCCYHRQFGEMKPACSYLRASESVVRCKKFKTNLEHSMIVSYYFVSKCEQCYK